MQEALMPNQAETEFYMQRERQERALADRTHSSDGRRVHLDMASRYARLAAGADDADTAPSRPAHL